MHDKIRQEDADWANQLREKYNSQYKSEAPEDLFEGLTEDDVEWVSQMLDDFISGGNKSKEEIDPDWLEQTQANVASAGKATFGEKMQTAMQFGSFLQQAGAQLGGNQQQGVQMTAQSNNRVAGFSKIRRARV